MRLYHGVRACLCHSAVLFQVLAFRVNRNIPQPEQQFERDVCEGFPC